MKKVLILMIALLLPMLASATDINGVNYNLDSSTKTATVVGGSTIGSYSGDVNIPPQVTYEGVTYTVTSIGGKAFSLCYDLTSVTIPNTVTSIGNHAFLLCSGLTSLIIPNSVTSIGSCAFDRCSSLTSVTIPNSVTSIDREAFIDCSSLNSVHISDVRGWCKIDFSGNYSNPLYYAHHLFLDGVEIKDLYIPNGITFINDYSFVGCNSLTSITIPNSVTSIGHSAFSGCSGLTSVAIPNSVTSIGNNAFRNCSGITSITIPNSVTNIGSQAFYECSELTTIVSEIKNPFAIEENVFYSKDNDIYAKASLTVPFGTKSLYHSAAGWNMFQTIVEGSTDEAQFTINGVVYQGTKSAKAVVVKSVDKSLTSVEIPASVSYDGTDYQVTGIDNDAFNGCDLAALIWNVEAVLPNNALSNAAIGSNFLLYVKSASYAPSTVKNVVVNGTASSILLSDDGGKFYCPEQFKANSISYTHYYSMETGGNGKGWETLALPFDVQKISHSTRGEIIPFAAYRNGLSQKPFWLANFTVSGFKRSSAIMANEPYIIAMPNSSSYNNNYNLAGSVTFSSEDIVIPKTPTFNGTFLPAFTTVPKASNVYALNVNNRNVTYSGTYDAGSRFISNLRDVRPFEAYMTGSSSTRSVIEINFDDGTTDINDILISANEDDEVTVHILSGLQIARTNKRDFDAVWQLLPKGVYIVNGKKKIK